MHLTLRLGVLGGTRGHFFFFLLSIYVLGSLENQKSKNLIENKKGSLKKKEVINQILHKKRESHRMN